MATPTLTFKVQSLYGAYAPDSGAYCFGACFEEAVNGLQAELAARAADSVQMATKGKAVQTADRPFRCHTCRRRFRSAASLRSHHNLDHSRARQCSNCGKELQEAEYHRC